MYYCSLIELVLNFCRYDEEYSALRSGATVTKTGSSNETGDHPLRDKNSKEAEASTPKYLIIPTASGQMKDVKEIKWFNCKKLSYLWDSETESFYRISGLDQTLSDLHGYQGFSWNEQLRRRIVYGENDIKVPVTPILKLLFLEALNPFYIFQVCSVCLWFADDYVYYASVIVVTSVLSIISEVYQMHKNQVSLSATIQSSAVVEVLRENGQSEMIPSEHLVPGDVLVIPPQGCMMQCDAALLQGTSIVNESMLTGESVPVTKTPILNRKDVLFKEKTRFYGNERVTAVVIRTGFLTTKGSLVRSIMYPPPVDFKFQQDTYKFILVLVGIASLGFVYSVVNKFQDGLSASEIVVDSLDLITIVVPPALPMAMTVGILYALQRLKRYNIYCISPRSINISGVLNCICFDKTGTLTEDGLDMKGVVDVREKDGTPFMGELQDSTMLPNDHLLYGMAACHSITIINLKQVGDPLDLKMFESTGWILEEPGNDDTCKYDMIMPSIVKPKEDFGIDEDETPLEIGIMRQFPFSSSLQRMSVITRKLNDPHFILYCKGSPEMIASLSIQETVPEDYQEVLLGYTRKGFRVLAMGWKPLKLSYRKAHRISRDEVEKDLHFLGLLVLENRLKEETAPVIRQLKNANIRTVMVTGDNMLTALSVGRECELVSPNVEVISVKAVPNEDRPDYTIHYESTSTGQVKKVGKSSKEVTIEMDNNCYCFAVEGKTWAVIHSHFPDVLKKLVVRGSIFARMSPDQKQQLIMELQALGYYECAEMERNDCGALKSAHAGISLSEAEASVASPFTSKDPNISCVPNLIREGRTALVTSFGIFKYMATYSLTQFVSVMILYSIHSNLTDIQFLYIDLFLITVFAFFFGRTESFKGPLASTPPSSSLISVSPILSILLHMAFIIFFQTFSFFYVQEQPWFVPFNSTTADDIPAGMENYAVYSVSQFQYIILAVVFAKGPPYRQPMYTNYFFTGSVVIMTFFSIFLTLAPTENIINAFQLVMPPEDDSAATWFRWQIFIFAIVNSIIAVIIENFIIDYVVHRKLKCKCGNEDKSKEKYLAIETAMQQDKNWPIVRPISVETKAGGNSEGDLKELSLNAKKLIKNNYSKGSEMKERNGK
ncbi:putative cation-transporting ATPase 13A3, partial [Armadillidium vulgare]